MTTLLVLIGVIAIGYLVACTVSGMQPAEAEISGFVSESGPLVRSFSDPADHVRSAYVQGAAAVAGMSVVRQDQQSILIDMKPTIRVLDGSFGMLLLVSFERLQSGTVVAVHAQRKVTFAVAVRLDAAFVQAERSLRMKSKRFGLNEVLTRP